MEWKRNYLKHDDVYKTRKAEGHPGWGNEEEADEFLDALETLVGPEFAAKGGKSLELGCGAGNVSRRLAKRGFAVHGVDIAPSAVQWAEENAERYGITGTFRVGSVLDLEGWPNDGFDLVVDGRCFHCIIGEDRPLFLASAKRVLKKDGIFLIATMCGEVTNPEMKKFMDKDSRYMIQNGYATRYIGWCDDILAEIKEAGFHIQSSYIQPRIDENDCEGLWVAASK